ncbi:MAG: RNA methyltransferase [Alphaproteobacteria bacterium]|nr:RNA methyltransferase [Alphaproteobacteria bacterium]
MRLALPARVVVGVSLILTLTGCLSSESREAVRVLRDIEAGPGPSDLKAATPSPTRRTIFFDIDGRRTPADVYDPGQAVGAELVLIPGFTRAGKDDPRVIDLAMSLARARFAVLVPDVPGSRDLRVSRRDSRVVADAVLYLARGEQTAVPLGVAAISYAVGPAVLAALMPEAGDAIDFVVGVGAYYDTADIITFMTTGGYRESASADWRFGDPYPASKWIFLAGNAEALENPSDRALLRRIADRRTADPAAPIGDLESGLGPDGRALLDLLLNTDPDRAAALIAELPANVSREISSLSLAPLDLTPLAGKLILIHGLEDRMIPYTESRALAAAVGEVELFLVEDFSHIDPRPVGWFGQLTLIDAMQAVLARRTNS